MLYRTNSNRREFLITAASIGAVIANSRFSYAEQKTKLEDVRLATGGGVIYTNSVERDNLEKKTAFLASTELMDLRRGSARTLPGFLRPHSVESCPQNPNSIFVIEKDFPKALIFDLKKSDVPLVIHAPEGHLFSGHALWLRDGKKICITTYHQKTDEGSLLVFDAKSGMLEKNYPSFGPQPHEIIHLEDRGIYVVANGGLKGNIAILDDKNMDLIELHMCPDEKQKLRHLRVNQEGVILGGSLAFDESKKTNSQLYISRISNPKSIRRLEWLAKSSLHSTRCEQFLSVAQDSSGHFGLSTALGADLCVLVALDAHSITHEFNVKGAQGIVPTAKPGMFLVSCVNGELWRCDAVSRRMELIKSSTKLIGPHLSILGLG